MVLYTVINEKLNLKLRLIFNFGRRQYFMNNFFNSLIFSRMLGIIFICLSAYELINAVQYTYGILHRGSENGFSLAAIGYSFFFGIILLGIGITGLVHPF